MQDSLRELKRQVQLHPSILPADFDITPAGELVLNVPTSNASPTDSGNASNATVGTASQSQNGGRGGGFDVNDAVVKKTKGRFIHDVHIEGGMSYIERGPT